MPLGTLAELAEPLIAVHGQSEAISLLRPGPQRAVLDRFAGLTAEVTIYRELRARCQRLAADLADRRARARERAQREQLLRIGLAEIEAAAPHPGEDRELVDEVRRLQNLDGLRAAAAGAHESLTGTEDTAAAPAAVGAGARGAAPAGGRRRSAARRTRRSAAAGRGRAGRCRVGTVRVPGRVG